MGRILYLAIADGRGHLMRASILRELLAERGVTVDLVTTSEEGARFLERLGHPSRVLSGGFQLIFDDHHCLDLRRTRLGMVRYLGRMARDLRRLEDWASGADLVVNDSMHPALLFAAAWRPKMRVVQVVGENIFLSATEQVRDESSAVLRNMAAGLTSSAFRRSFGRIFHCLEGTGRVELTWRLPPILKAPSRTVEEVRRQLGPRIAAVYLNPHYASPAIAEAVERAVQSRGLTLYGVSEAFADRPGWRATDPRFVDVVAAADVLISGAGMAALEQSRTFGVPLIALLGDQPEQAKNVRQRGCASVSARSSELFAELVTALDARTTRSGPGSQLQATHAAWMDAFEALLNAARMEKTHDDGVAGDRDGEPQGRRSAG